jgi:phenylalanyl-tRNA synthetase alpha chain
LFYNNHMPTTKLLYLEDSYKQTASATVISISTVGSTSTIVLNQSLFYPQGGGQPSDKGTIVGPHGSCKVTHAQFRNGLIEHIGKLTGSINEDEEVNMELDWQRRYHHMQMHTAGHMLDEAVKKVLPEFHGIDGMHGIGNKTYIIYPGFIDAANQDNIQQQLNQLIQDDLPITSRMVTKAEIEKEGITIPFALPSNKPLRLIQFGDLPPVPDGGTQLKSTGMLWPTNITEFSYDEGNTIIHYQVIPPADVAKASTSTTIESFSQALSDLKTEVAGLNVTESNKIAILGKKGTLNQIASKLRELSPEDRKQAGKVLNQVKAHLETYFIQQNLNKSEDSFLDVTIPGRKPNLGHLHPVTQAIDEIQRIFESIGFTRVRYPEVDWDYYAFEALNMPKKHPARDEWETFFIDAPVHPKLGKVVLTPHTSNGQVREMERVGKPPIRMLNIAKCYRRQEDVTHTAMFHQFEGLVIDKGITIQHLKGTLDYFAKKFYGEQAKSRIRPFMFKFTEPSFEVDFSCVHCDGKGCRFCKSGWHEVGGAGMVHPNVLRFGGIDPNEYTGFAFGWGIERVYTLKPGLHLDDIRPLYQNKLDFLKQF